MLFPKVVIVILNWNGKVDTLECLRSVFAVEYSNFDIFVVDNGSTDNSVEVIRQHYPSLRIIQTGRNLGYAGGNNLGIKEALNNGAEFVLLLNNDTTVDPGLVKNFVAAAKKKPKAGIFGAKIYFHSEPNKIWFFGGDWNERRSWLVHVGLGQQDQGESFNRITETNFVTGCALFIRRHVVEAIGLMDERFFLVFEDADWCFRARKKGYQCAVVPGALVWHKIGVSFDGEESPLRTYFSFRNCLLFAEQNLTLVHRIGFHISVYKGFGDRFLRPILLNRKCEHRNMKERYWALMGSLRSPLNKAWLWALHDYWFRRFGNCPDRVRDLNRRWSDLNSVLFRRDTK
jgi:GT2 family glycosyltransferase